VEPDPGFEAFLQRVAARLVPVDFARVPVAQGGVTHAAVALLLRPENRTPGSDPPGDSAEILFIKRAIRAGDPWSGHLAFPGGRAEERDASLLEIAMREATEEVGIDARQGGRLLGRLPTLRPSSASIPSITVTPFVALVPAGAVPRPQPEEVQEAFWIPLAALRGTGLSAIVRWNQGGHTRTARLSVTEGPDLGHHRAHSHSIPRACRVTLSIRRRTTYGCRNLLHGVADVVHRDHHAGHLVLPGALEEAPLILPGSRGSPGTVIRVSSLPFGEDAW
jgi:8-oxo-dGTP pyrophosphatase MutT (NUDIX family)